MEINLRIHVKPMSVNSMYYGDKKHGKRPEAISWSEEVLYSLRKYEKEIENLSSLFDKKKHSYIVSFVFNIPVDYFYTKSGEMSSRVMDITNVEKPLLDLLFLPKFYGTDYPKKAKNINIDDRYVRKVTSEKIPSDSWFVDVVIRIEKKPTFVSSKDL